MIGTLIRVARSEGWPSAMRRLVGRCGEAAGLGARLARGMLAGKAGATVLNVCGWPMSERFGGVAVQLASRLEEERRYRSVALLQPGVLDLSRPVRHAVRSRVFGAAPLLFDDAFESAVASALERTRARALHLEGTAGIPLGSALRLAESGIELILTIHDFSLFCARPNLLEEPHGVFCGWSTDDARCLCCLRRTWSVAEDVQLARRSAAASLLARASAVIFPSEFMLRRHAGMFSLPDMLRVIEPGVSSRPARAESPLRHRIAIVGAVGRHKGTHLLPSVAEQLRASGVEWHIFGGGDAEVLQSVRSVRGAIVHGWYRAGELPQLLARNRIGLVLFPSVVPESYGLALSECWQAGVPVVAFAHGAQGERIEAHGGGWTVPVECGAAGLADRLRRWMDGDSPQPSGAVVQTAQSAATAHLTTYESLGLADGRA